MCQVEMKAEKNPVGLGIGSMYWVLYRVQWSRRLLLGGMFLLRCE